MQIPEDQIERALGDEQDEPEEAFEIWPENVHPLNCFLRVRRQWRVSPAGVCIGFDWTGVRAVLQMRKIKINNELLDDLEVMETAALEVMNARQ